MVPLGPLLGLASAMAVKHFCADFLMQTAAIARGKAGRRRWLAPLLLHAFGHAILTLGIALVFFPRVWWIAPAEFVVHAGIDRAKVLVGNGLHAEMTTPAFWWLLGFDQLLHHLTNVAIVGVFATQLVASVPAVSTGLLRRPGLEVWVARHRLPVRRLSGGEDRWASARMPFRSGEAAFVADADPGR